MCRAVSVVFNEALEELNMQQTLANKNCDLKYHKDLIKNKKLLLLLELVSQFK